MFFRRWFLVAILLGACLHVWQAPAFGQPDQIPGAREESPPPPSKTNEIEILPTTPPETRPVPSAPSLPEVKIPNFVSCAIEELQQTVPELRGLKTAHDQEKLAAVLAQVGAKTVDLVRRTPNLISNEAVVEFQPGVGKTRQNFSYLILSHARGPDVIALEEFRVDLQSGEKFETENAENERASQSPSSSAWGNLTSTSRELPGWKSGRPPLAQGFANMWIYFYPPNQPESTFRYLGEQKMDGHHTLVLAFAQKPGSVRVPAIFRFEGKSFPIFFQGVAWVDASDFRIVRLRTDLLSSLPEVSLRQLTADIQFAQTRLAEVASPLWLPRDVAVTSDLRGLTLRDKHKYSNYRLFRVQSKILLNP